MNVLTLGGDVLILNENVLTLRGVVAELNENVLTLRGVVADLRGVVADWGFIYDLRLLGVVNLQKKQSQFRQLKEESTPNNKNLRMGIRLCLG